MKKITAANIQVVINHQVNFYHDFFYVLHFLISLMSSKPFVAVCIELQNYGKILPGNHGCWYWKGNECSFQAMFLSFLL